MVAASASTASRVARERRAQASIRTCAALVSRFRGSRRRRGVRPATRGTSRDAAAVLARNEQRPLLLRRAESRYRRSAAGARARRPSRLRESRARLRRAATRRRAAIEPGAAMPRATRMRRSPSAARFRPAGEPVGGRGPENVDVASSQLATRVGRVDLRGGDRPDDRRTRAFPADRDCAVVAAYLMGCRRRVRARARGRSSRRPSSWACIRSADALGP